MGTFAMPSLGADMAAGTLVEWLKKPGDTVQSGDIIAVVETDKGAIEVEVFEAGRIGDLLVDEGKKVPVGTPLARIVGEREAKETAAAHSPAPTAGAASAPPSSTREIPPSAKKAAHLRASPAARRLAAERGIAIGSLVGSGRDGTVHLADVMARGGEQAKLGASPDFASMRRAIAAAMARSKREIPHYYLLHRFDVSPALDWLSHYNAERPPPKRLLLGVLQLKAVALALTDFPEFNGHYGEQGFVASDAVNLGSAIAIRGGGLGAPCITNADTLPLSDLMERLGDLVVRTRRGLFRSSELGNATVTVSSLGDRGVESLWPIIYPPQVAIIGFGSVMRRPWVREDSLEVRPVVTVTLSGDHRANDGHRGALLLRRIEDLLSEPEKL